MASKEDKIQFIIDYATRQGSKRGRLHYEEKLDSQFGKESHQEHQNIITELFTLDVLELINDGPYLKLGIEGLRINELGTYVEYIQKKKEKEDLNNAYLLESFELVKKTNETFKLNQRITIVAALVGIISLILNVAGVFQYQQEKEQAPMQLENTKEAPTMIHQKKVDSSAISDTLQ